MPRSVTFESVKVLPLLVLGLSCTGGALAGELRYELDYPLIAYSAQPISNEIARLQQQLDRGDLPLEFVGSRGYLDSLLRALHINPSSQVLVYSKTSLQFHQISAATPRAIYFNDDTYVAWVQGSEVIEIATMDAARGAVFYTLKNRQDARVVAERQTSVCLSCHDTFSMTGGGVPRFLFLSAPVDSRGVLPPRQVSIETDDRTPLRDRWGGWYVTGDLGGQPHKGNTVSGTTGNLQSLAGLFDTRPYLTEKSDAVALLVLEHQLYIKNLITRLNFKARTYLSREGVDSWEKASTQNKLSMQRMMDGLVEALLFAHAEPLTRPVRGSAGFEGVFVRKGPHDVRGRTLREFDLQRRLFKYPLSYVVYSEGFDALPDSCRLYIYRRLRDILTGRDRSATFAHLSDADRSATLEIFTETKPDFARTSAPKAVPGVD
jgi:hypothetical protein